MIKDLEKKLSELGLLYRSNPDYAYILCNNDDVGRTIKVKLICSDQAEESKYDSRNGNIIQSIGAFNLSSSEYDADFLIFGLESRAKRRMDFVIIPTNELKRRLFEGNRISIASHKISIIFWLMDDRFLYDCTGIGIEGEWYYLSRGADGRMADGSVLDYSEFLDDWKRLKMI